MSASDNPRPNQVKYQARKVAATNNTARKRIGPEARTRFTPRTAGSLEDSDIESIQSGGIDLVKHEVHDYAGNRDVKPKWQRNARNLSVANKIHSKRAIESKSD